MSVEPTKAAENETAKLTAAYYNNIAVGVLLGGLYIPLFAILQRINVDDFRGKGLGIDILKAILPWPQSFGLVAVALSALIISASLHVWALSKLKKLKD